MLEEFSYLGEELAHQVVIDLSLIHICNAMENFKKQQKASEITEDELKMAEKDLQKLTDDSCKELDKLLENKEKELLSV